MTRADRPAATADVPAPAPAENPARRIRHDLFITVLLCGPAVRTRLPAPSRA